MRLGRRESKRVAIVLVVVSAVAWIVLLADAGSTSITHCPVTESGGLTADSVAMLIRMNPVSSLAAGWFVMLVAMMAPTLISPVRHVLERSFKRRRGRSVGLFLIGYAVVWMSAGVVLVATALLLGLIAPQSIVPVSAFGIVAIVWHCSPQKQVCLNRNHNHRELAAFGPAADIDVLKFGLSHGLWCFGSCWALMLLPMLIGNGHLVAMVFVTYVMISERFDRAREPRWGIALPSTLVRMGISKLTFRGPLFGRG